MEPRKVKCKDCGKYEYDCRNWADICDKCLEKRRKEINARRLWGWI
jgi:hypothetical protein